MCEVSILFPSNKNFGGVVRGFEGLFQDAPRFLHSQIPVVPDSWAGLPLHILVQILQHVPVQDRFRHAALVNPDWAAAAIESTDSICLPGKCSQLFNLQSWLVQHGSSIHTVSVTGQVDEDVVLLPCSKLRQLDLSEVTVQLLPVTGGLFPGILRDVTQLTRFTLRQSSVIGGPDALTSLAPLTDLQHLCLAGLDTKQSSPSSTDWFPVPGSIFSQLVKLTHLELDKVAASSTLEHLAQLTLLESLLLGRLSLHNANVMSLSGLDRLTRLRWLRIEGLDANISTLSLPSLGQLTGLTKLQLLNCKGFQPILLSGMLELVELDLQGTSLLGTGGVVEVPAAAAAAAVVQVQLAAAGNGAGAAAGAEVGGNEGAAAGGNNAAQDPAAAALFAATQAASQAAAGATALLHELQKLQKLTQLHIVQVMWAPAAGQPAAAYAALTASSTLCELDLSFSLVPSEAWQYIFNGSTQTLTDLRSLSIHCCQAHMTDADVASIARCCPRVQELGLKGTLKPGLSLSALTGLTALTKLSVNHVSSDHAVGVLAELRGLEDLQMSVQSSIRASGLLQLTSLKGLTRLRVESSPETWIATFGMVLLENKAPAGSPPDVWSQLHTWCLHRIPLAHDTAPTPQEQRQKKPSKLLQWLLRCVTA